MKLPGFVTTLLTDYFRWLAGGVVVLILGLGYWLIIGQQLSSIQTTHIAARNQVEGQVKTQQQFLDDLRASIDKFHRVLPASSLSSIDDFLPSSTDFPGLLLTIRNIAASSNVNLQTLALSQTGEVAANQLPAATANGSGTEAQAAAVTSLSVKTQDVNITVAGGTSYTAFKRFLANIENSRRLLDVTSVAFSVGKTGGDVYTLTIRTYYLPSKS